MASGTETRQFTGRVKWFNSKSGYGFITVTDGERSGQDIFVHHSGVSVSTEQYRYLVQGEYVSFNLIDVPETKSEHTVQATQVSGVNGGQLMCETRREMRDSRPKRQTPSQTQSTPQRRYRQPSQHQRRPTSQRSQSGHTEQPTTWRLVPDSQPYRDTTTRGRGRGRRPPTTQQ